MKYLSRITDATLAHLLRGLPAVAVDGAKAVGKTATSQRLANSVISLDQPDQLTAIQENPDRIMLQARPLLIDEWQLFPPVWDKVRRAVDRGADPGSFILAGSASPSNAPKHTGAGRIVRLRMRPMSLAERALEQPAVSMADLLSDQPAQLDANSDFGFIDYAEEITASGLPGVRRADPVYRSELLDSYVDNVVEREFVELGSKVRKPHTLRAWLRAYAAATSTAAAYQDVLDAATAGQSDKPNRGTTLIYREVLERLWLLDELPAWIDTSNHLKGLARSPRHHLADPALAAHLLGATAASLARSPNPDQPIRPRQGTLFGALFESLAVLCVKVYAAPLKGEVSYLRTKRGEHEVDLIVQRPDGAIAAFEVKSSAEVTSSDVRHLLWLKDRFRSRLVDLAVINTGTACFRRRDGVGVIPLALLGP